VNPLGTPAGDRRITVLSWLSGSLMVSVVFSAGVMYQRMASIESRVTILEGVQSQMNALVALQAEVKTLHEENQRVRDRVDRAVDSIGKFR
jgi:hypothetical protein